MFATPAIVLFILFLINTFLGKGAGDSDLSPLVIMGSAVSVIPLIALVLVLQRFWRADLLAGGLKG